jgi:hypothetical protein
MSAASTVLATATTALRDLHMGWPHFESAALNGEMGLDPLVHSLVAELRGRGVDDEGGWNCAVTEGIAVADAVPDGDPDIQMLAAATTALRDLSMDWQPREICALNGEAGLPALVRGLVSELRGRGLDDEGGWNCPETQNIAVGSPPLAR